MAKSKGSATAAGGVNTADYRHGEKRTNNPPAKIAAEGKVPAVPKVQYAYNPHLPPVLRFDSTGAPDKLPELLAEATHRALKPEEARLVAEALRQQQPWLEWAGKKEQHDRRFFEVDPVALHIHERVSAQAIVSVARRKDVQRSLFADPEQPYDKAVQFYKHDVDWANRLILGDSLQVMSSLARRENLAGKVQMIYMDPPYGIKFASNFQPEVGKRDVKDRETDLTREPEMVKAYRDTWNLGIHSYLAYLRDRLIVARELLGDKGSVFVQISDENVHRVRDLLDDVFGSTNLVAQIVVQKTGGLGASGLKCVADYLLWYAKDRARLKYQKLLLTKVVGEGEGTGARYDQLELATTGVRRSMTAGERNDASSIPAGWKPFQLDNLTSGAFRENTTVPYFFEGETYHPGANACWKTTVEGLDRLTQAGRIQRAGRTLRYVRMLGDFPAYEVTNVWDDVAGSPDKVYVVQTSPSVIARCVLMTTEPGDLVLDPTCGSGTTAYVAEQWGRRWITIDTSRVALSIARQRLLTAKFDQYRTKGGTRDGSDDPATGFEYKKVPHITLGSIAQSQHLDPIFAKHEPLLDVALATCNRALAGVSAETRKRLAGKLAAKESAEGRRAITDADRRRWELPASKFEPWTVPFDTDPDWPKPLQDAVAAYRKAWRAKMDEVNACIAANAEQEELVDQPEVVRGIVRVSGPLTVEGVRPAELSLGDEGLFDGAPEATDGGEGGGAASGPVAAEPREVEAYLREMLQFLRADGITFPNNKHANFARLEPLFETATGSLIHAEGAFEGTAEDEGNPVGVAFGPQCGPVTAAQVEELIRASRRYTDLVIAGFSFEADASSLIQENPHPKLKIHRAHIRPDVNPGMKGLLKDQPGSQLFTVFGEPEIEVKGPDKGGSYVVRLVGVDIYDPVQNTVFSSGADKVAAWFLDQDHDGRCFCTTQAFFPSQDAWEKIARALGSSADGEAFAAFQGTTSLPFAPGKHRRVAVKVIDPRGNEVTAVRSLGR